jgi:hypothetical protein
LALAIGASGCGVMKSMTNPSAAWALSESTPMSVIVRRAEVARGVADQVDRLMSATPVDEATAKALSLENAEAQKLLQATAGEPIYAASPAPIRVVPAEAWLSMLGRACGEQGEDKTLVSMLGEEVGGKYGKLAAQAKEIATHKALIKELEQKKHEDGTSDADKAGIDKKIAELEQKIEAVEKEHDPAVEALVGAVRAAAQKASADDRARMSPIVVNLREAVDDARAANGAAVVRYPLALPSLKDDIQIAAKRFAADYIEEKTGHRPDMNGLAPSVALEGTDVKLTINNVPADKLGEIAVDELVEETVARTQRYAGRALTLIGYVDETEERLGLQAKILEAWAEGLGATVASAKGAVHISDVEVAAKPGAAAAKTESAGDGKGKRSLTGLRAPSCGAADSDGAVKDAKVKEPAADKSASKPQDAKETAKAGSKDEAKGKDKGSKPAGKDKAPAKADTKGKTAGGKR